MDLCQFGFHICDFQKAKEAPSQQVQSERPYFTTEAGASNRALDDGGSEMPNLSGCLKVIAYGQSLPAYIRLPELNHKGKNHA